MNDRHTPEPWRLSTMPTKEEMLKAIQSGQDAPITGSLPNRDNNGAFIILAGEGDSTKRIGTADFQGKALRGKAWATEDPEGLANARLMILAPAFLSALRTAERDFSRAAGSARDSVEHRALIAARDRIREVLSQT